jgi:apolipoprotein N-acyltransferase
MATSRTVALGLAVGVIFACYLAFWLHVVLYIATAAGASALVLILVLAAAFGEDAEVADAAWRRAAGARAGREPGERSAYEPATWAQPKLRGGAGEGDDDE